MDVILIYMRIGYGCDKDLYEDRHVNLYED